MASSSSSFKHLHVLLYGKLYVPALSLALLTGFTFSITLPFALQALLPSFQSLFFVSLPHLWHASLSWFTPPCLFLLLNGIIMILTATSGSFSNPSSSPSPTNFLAKLEKFTCKTAVAPSDLSAAATTFPIEPHALHITPPGIDPSTVPALQLEVPIVSFTDIPLCYHCLHAKDADMGDNVICHAPDADMEELPKNVICQGDVYDINNSSDDNMKEMQIPSQGKLQQTVEIVDRLGINGSDDPLFEEVLKGGSEPSTPKYSSNSPAIKDNMRRSLSIDSVPCIDNVEESPEYKMSEEAFKKRIEDYIFKVNAKLRSETRFT